MAKRRKRRIKSPHPGVKLKRRALPSGGHSWRAVYRDADSGREVYVTLDPKALSTNEARVEWAKRLSADLARRRMDRAAGLRPTEATALEAAIKAYVEGAQARGRLPKTLAGHELAFGKLREWAKREGVRTTADLTRTHLASLADFVARAPRKSAKRGEGRGAHRATSTRRSPVTINREQRSLKTLMNTWRTEGRLAGLHRDDIRDTLKALEQPRPDPAFLRPAELRALLAAALRHDEATFAETREEHIGRRPKGSTPRYVPIAPFVAFVLLTGMRRSEALALPWSLVDLEAVDHEGRRVGEIRLTAKITKTKRDRTIGLEVSPALRRLLAAMKLASGGAGHVFGGREPYTADVVEAARRRMLRTPDDESTKATKSTAPRGFGAPGFDWQSLRSTCATYLTNAPGIFGAATVFLSARQLGHSVAVAERHYLGVHRGIPRDAHTLEAAMQIEGELARVVASVSARPKAKAVAR